MPTGRWARRAAATALLVAVAGVPSTPASAHSGGGADASYYRATVSSIAPHVPGVTVTADHHGEWIEVTSTTAATVEVLGYLKEPFLRITPAGVQENQLAPTTFLNRSLFTDATAAGKGSATAAPVWKAISTGTTARWHDHRIHWMGAAAPPAVAADPEHPHPVGTWTVHLLAGSTPVTVEGTLSWAGRPSPATIPGGWIAGIAAGLLALFAGVVTVVRLRRREAVAEPESQVPELV